MVGRLGRAALGGLVLLVACAGTGAAAPNPPQNVELGRLPSACDTQPTGGTCENAVIHYLDAARATMGLGPYQLPPDFPSLSPDRQLLVLSNLDRLAYALPPVPGLDATLSASAALGATGSYDPDPPADYFPPNSAWGYTSNWAGGFANTPMAYYFWMYADGYPGGNLDCTQPDDGGCWGHRQDVLWDAGELTLSMGAAVVTTSSGHPGYAMLITGSDPPAPSSIYYAWADAAADGAGTFPYDPGPIRFDVALGIALDGRGHGRVTGSVSCADACSATLLEGQQVHLTALPARGSTFTGWRGACSETGACDLTLTADAQVDASFALRPLQTTIALARIESRSHRASFHFRASAGASGFQCALVRQPPRSRRAPRPRFAACRSPWAYRGLPRGRYRFWVRAVGPVGADRTPATRAFSIL